MTCHYFTKHHLKLLIYDFVSRVDESATFHHRVRRYANARSANLSREPHTRKHETMLKAVFAKVVLAVVFERPSDRPPAVTPRST